MTKFTSFFNENASYLQTLTSTKKLVLKIIEHVDYIPNKVKSLFALYKHRKECKKKKKPRKVSAEKFVIVMKV